MTAELLNRFFIPVFLAVGFSMKLWGSRGSTDRSVRYYWLTIFSIVILIAADALESWAQRDPGLVLFRTAFTVIGYVMRPVAALSIVLIIYPKEHRPWLLWIPVLVNLAVYITAFFSPAACAEVASMRAATMVMILLNTFIGQIVFSCKGNGNRLKNKRKMEVFVARSLLSSCLSIAFQILKHCFLYAKA